MPEAISSLTASSLAFLGIALLVAFAFEFVNGFHDTANAVATVIYTRTLPAGWAVAWSGLWNFIGVQVGGTAVAFAVLEMLPASVLTHSAGREAHAVILALLLAAILWNVGTWWLGLPSSSSHALIGSILGAGLAYGLTRGEPLADGIAAGPAFKVLAALAVSPLIGFGLAWGAQKIIVRIAPSSSGAQWRVSRNHRPPTWVRGILIGTCTGVSFSHGANDGQKGIGLVLLILIGTLPSVYAPEIFLNPATRHVPSWIVLAVACALGLGTVVGWRRIVQTVGRKIGKRPLRYSQGAVAESVAFATIFAASRFGLPVSTTHLLSSGVAGTMVATRAGVQRSTITRILLAWVFTLPVCAAMAAGLFFTLRLLRV